MRIIEVSPGSAAWRVEISDSERRWKTVRTLIGELPASDLDRCIDAEDFIAEVWKIIGRDGFMGMTLSLAGTDVVWISSECHGGVSEINDLTYNSDTCPAGLGGGWIV